MHDLPRQKLSELLAEHGPTLCDDTRRLEGLLKDVLRNEYKRETFVLISALREGVVYELRGSTSGMPPAALAAKLTRQLCDNLGLEEAVARWGVESWDVALRVQILDPQSSVSNPKFQNSDGASTVTHPPKDNTPNPEVVWPPVKPSKSTLKAFECAIAAIKSGNSTRAFLKAQVEVEIKKWESEASRGNAEAQWLLGDCYLEGIDGRRDDQLARQWFQRASDSGLSWGDITLASMWLHGVGGDVDITAGVSLLRKSIVAGYPEANQRLANHYLRCEGKPGRAKAQQLLSDAADQGNAGAMHALAINFLTANAPEDSDSRQYLTLVEKAAELGYLRSKVLLAKMLLGEVVHDQVRPDTAKALKILHEAAKEGHSAAVTLLEQHGVFDYRQKQQVINGSTMVLIPAGRFRMGSEAIEVSNEKQFQDEMPAHSVLISHDFWLSQTVITQAQYRSILGKNPSKHKWSWFDKGRRPVEQVRWFDAVKYCNALSNRAGLPEYYLIAGDQVTIKGGTGYRLPTESEWEMACRARTTSPWSWGPNERVAEKFGSFGIDLISASTHIVGQHKCNAFGLQDMHGGVWEWCWDYYSEEYYSETPSIDPLGPTNGTLRVARGGSYWEPPANCRSAAREGYSPDKKDQDLGFRIARSV